VNAQTRRAFVKRSAGAAAGATVIGALIADQAGAQALDSDPVVAYVSDPRRGEISLMIGEREVSVRDRNLAAQIVRAAR
jgi:hypothetical protein